MRLAILLFASLVSAQNSQRPITTFSTGVQVVNLFAVAKNSSGHTRNNLRKDDFKLQVDGKPQSIAYFSQQTDLPLTLGLLVDTSASMLRVFDTERLASTKFLKQVLRQHSDQAFLIHFDRTVELLQPLTSSRRKMQSALGILDSQTWFRRQMESHGSGRPNGKGTSTALYDAIVLSATRIMSGQQNRKAIILFSDGVDDGSTSSLNEAIGATLRADTSIYSMQIVTSTEGIRTSGEEKRRQEKFALGRQVLTSIARETGGSFFEATDKRNMSSIFSEIDDELRSQYNLGFTPSKEGITPGFHHVSLTTVLGDFTVQTREGYFSSSP